MKKLIVVLSLLSLAACASNSSQGTASTPSSIPAAIASPAETPNIELTAEVKALVGTGYVYPRSLDLIDRYGHPETLAGTNNSRWVAYFPKGDFTIVTNKENNVIQEVLPGKVAQQ